MAIIGTILAYYWFILDIILTEVLLKEYNVILTLMELNAESDLIKLITTAQKLDFDNISTRLTAEERFLTHLHHCCYNKYYWIFMLYTAPLETWKFFCVLNKIIINYVIMSIFPYLSFLIDISIDTFYIYEESYVKTATWPLFKMWVCVTIIAVLTIWARGVGPRFRPDQLSNITWKDILILLGGLLVIVLILVIT